MSEILTSNAFKERLAYFTGSDHVYKDALTRLLYTEGVAYFMENNMSWMITDMLVILAMVPRVKNENFVLCHFRVNKDGKSASMLYTDGNSKALYKQDYTTIDTLVDDVKFYFTNNTLLLPSEY